MRQLFQIKEVKIIPIWYNEMSYILYNTYIGIFWHTFEFLNFK